MEPFSSSTTPPRLITDVKGLPENFQLFCHEHAIVTVAQAVELLLLLISQEPDDRQGAEKGNHRREMSVETIAAVLAALPSGSFVPAILIRSPCPPMGVSSKSWTDLQTGSDDTIKHDAQVLCVSNKRNPD